MATITQETRFDLAQHELVRIAHARGQALTCDSGEAWITVDGDARDIILQHGETWRFDGDTEVVISAIKESSLSMRRSEGFRSPPSGMRRLLCALRNCEVPPLAVFPAQPIH